jgi:CheY-like chemotaxis protein
MKRILVLDRYDDLPKTVAEVLQFHPGVEMVAVQSVDAAKDVLKKKQIDLIISELKIPRVVDGLKFLIHLNIYARRSHRMIVTDMPEATVMGNLKGIQGVRYHQKPVNKTVFAEDILECLRLTTTRILKMRLRPLQKIAPMCGRIC